MYYKKQTINPNDTPFLNWCLENKLYKEEEGFNSRMKNIYSTQRKFESLDTIIVFQSDKPIGIVLCENHTYESQAFILKNPNNPRSKQKELLDWKILDLGFLSLYVKEEFRNQGIATELIKKIEIQRIKQSKQFIEKDTVILFEGKEKTYDLANKHLQYSYVTHLEKHNGNYQQDIYYLTRAILEKRSEDESPMYDLPSRKKLKI
jgi:GNAT superfamily N-acetyltransferase